MSFIKIVSALKKSPKHACLRDFFSEIVNLQTSLLELTHVWSSPQRQYLQRFEPYPRPEWQTMLEGANHSAVSQIYIKKQEIYTDVCSNWHSLLGSSPGYFIRSIHFSYAGHHPSAAIMELYPLHLRPTAFLHIYLSWVGYIAVVMRLRGNMGRIISPELVLIWWITPAEFLHYYIYFYFGYGGLHWRSVNMYP